MCNYDLNYQNNSCPTTHGFIIDLSINISPNGEK